jgi:hypothetical protein
MRLLIPGPSLNHCLRPMRKKRIEGWQPKHFSAKRKARQLTLWFDFSDMCICKSPKWFLTIMASWYFLSIASGDSSKFSINPSTAAIYLKEPLDFEAAQTHTITIQVADQGISPQKISSATLTVNVLNANDNAPVSRKLSGIRHCIHIVEIS